MTAVPRYSQLAVRPLVGHPLVGHKARVCLIYTGGTIGSAEP